MADFYPILARAVSGLSDNTPEARAAIYARAGAALLRQLRSIDPPMSEADIAREQKTLDDATARLEAQYPEPEVVEPEIATPDNVLFTPELPGQTSVVQPPAETEPVVVSAPPAPLVPRPDPVSAPAANARPAVSARSDASPERDDEALSPVLPPVLSMPDAPERPRVSVSAPKMADPARKRGLIVAGGVAFGVAAIAGAAIYMNKIAPPDTVARNSAEVARSATPPVENGPKNSERVGSEGAISPSAPLTPRSTPSTGAPPAPRNEIAVAQRAVLYVEGADANSQPKAVNGRVFWRLDSEAAGVGRPVETIVRASVEVPDAGLMLDFTLRRNTDAAFPASHLIGLRFSRSSDDGNGAVKETGVPQFKNDENERGAPISAIASTLGDNLFVAALSGVPVEIERNLDLILKRNWVDVPVRFASGKRGILAFEKGLSGAQTLEDAVGRWR